MRQTIHPPLALLLVSGFLASCAVVAPAPPAPVPPAEETSLQAMERRAMAPRPAYNLTGYPPAVREGYIDGCETARNSEFGRKDAKRFAADARYRMGWNDGLSICSRN